MSSPASTVPAARRVRRGRRPAVYRLGEPGEERDVALGRRPDRPLARSSTRTLARFVAATGRAVAPPLARSSPPRSSPTTRRPTSPSPTRAAFCAWAGGAPADRRRVGGRGPRRRDGRAVAVGRHLRRRALRVRRVAAGAGPRRSAPTPPARAACGAEQLAGNVWEWVADRADDGRLAGRARRLLPRPRLGRARLARARRRPRARHAHHRLPHRRSTHDGGRP